MSSNATCGSCVCCTTSTLAEYISLSQIPVITTKTVVPILTLASLMITSCFSALTCQCMLHLGTLLSLSKKKALAAVFIASIASGVHLSSHPGRFNLGFPALKVPPRDSHMYRSKRPVLANIIGIITTSDELLGSYMDPARDVNNLLVMLPPIFSIYSSNAAWLCIGPELRTFCTLDTSRYLVFMPTVSENNSSGSEKNSFPI